MSSVLKLAVIHIGGGTQQRAEINQDVVREYAEAIESGVKFPPAVVFHDGVAYWLAAGFHRYHAYKKAGRDEMPVEIRDGTLRDAILFSVGDNHDHGLRRSNEDKRKAVLTLLNDEEWGKRSDRWVAEQAKVHHATVAKIRKDFQVDNYPPEKVTGQDGKLYSPKKPPTTKPKPESNGQVKMPEPMEVEVGCTEEEAAALTEAGLPTEPTREPGSDTRGLGREKSNKPKIGSEKFNWTEFNSAFGKLARQPDELYRGYGLTFQNGAVRADQRHAEMLKTLGAFREQFRQAFKAITKQEPPE